MNESYNTERTMSINALREELIYMEKELPAIKQECDYKAYTALMRMYLTTQKAYLKLIAEEESESGEADALLDFTATA